MTIVFCDTETTGIDPRDSGAFEVAFLIYKDGKLVMEKLYHLNPLNDEVKWGEEAYKVNGVTEETIRSYPPFEAVVPEIIEDLKKYLSPEKYVFGGFKCGFDYGHIGALFYRAGFQISDYFSGRLIDVYDRAKQAMEDGDIPQTKDQKLKTLAKALNIDPGNSHTAMDDIKTTRRLYELLWYIQVKKEKKDGVR